MDRLTKTLSKAVTHTMAALNGNTKKDQIMLQQQLIRCMSFVRMCLFYCVRNLQCTNFQPPEKN